MSVIDFIKDTQGELKHVSWPTKKQAIYSTLLVVGVCVGLGIVLGILDFGFTKGIGALLAL